ncbi:MAG: hypothetical protein FJ265_22815, partial [Planctomycetes bacterium]|nr:hypothetical protein [Planctomycetota bacterium]
MTNHWEGNPYRRPNSPLWHIVDEDQSGVVRRRSTKTKDLRIAREFLATTLREVELQKAGRTDPFAEARTRPVNEFVVEFKQHLEAERCAPRHVSATLKQIRAFLAFAKITTIPSITTPTPNGSSPGSGPSAARRPATTTPPRCAPSAAGSNG